MSFSARTACIDRVELLKFWISEITVIGRYLLRFEKTGMK